MNITSDQKLKLKQIIVDYQQTDSRIEELKKQLIDLRAEYELLTNKIKNIEEEENKILQSIASSNPDYSFTDLVNIIVNE